MKVERVGVQISFYHKPQGGNFALLYTSRTCAGGGPLFFNAAIDATGSKITGLTIYLPSLELSNALGSNMVLQRGPRPAVVWGFASPGASVTTAFAGQDYVSMADSSGMLVWSFVLYIGSLFFTLPCWQASGASRSLPKQPPLPPSTLSLLLPMAVPAILATFFLVTSSCVAASPICNTIGTESDLSALSRTKIWK